MTGSELTDGEFANVSGRSARTYRLRGAPRTVCRRRRATGLAELAEILARPLPAGISSEPGVLGRGLRIDDELARRVWSHPVFVALVAWTNRYYRASRDSWEEMAVYALSRAPLYQAGETDVAAVRRGIADTARWVALRGRNGERLDSLHHVDIPTDVIAPPFVEVPSEGRTQGLGVPGHRFGVTGYLRVVAGDLPASAGAVVEETWQIAAEHYTWLADLTGLRGEALLAAGQARNDVNRSRRLLNRLPEAWPPATRKAAALLFTGSPSTGPGLLTWWSTTCPDDIPHYIRSRWSALLAVVDPQIGALSEEGRRFHRDTAKHMTIQAANPCIGI